MATSKLKINNALLRNSEPTEKRRGRPPREDLIHGDSKLEGLPEGYTRFSIICKQDNIQDLRDYAYTKRISLRDALDEVIETFFDSYRNDPESEELLDHTQRRSRYTYHG